jgi:hypothetical protein
MADVLASGVIYFQDGTTVPVQNTAQTEGSKEEILTDAEITTTAQSIGDYGPKKTIVAGYICVANAAAYCYVERQGVPISFINIGKAGMAGGSYFPASARVLLQPGDKLYVYAQTAADRTASLLTQTNQGSHRVFQGTPSGSGSTALLDTITSNTIGDTLGGSSEVIQKALLVSGDGTLLTSAGGAWIKNNIGNVAGAFAAQDSENHFPLFTNCSIQVNLNYTAAVELSA